MGRPATGKTPLRNIRAADEVWDTALANAHAKGKTLTEVIVNFLKDYNAECAKQRATDSDTDGEGTPISP